MVEVIFVHTMLTPQPSSDHVRARSTVIFNCLGMFGGLEIFSVPIVEKETGEIVIDTGAVIIDCGMRKLAEEAILADCWALANSSNI